MFRKHSKPRKEDRHETVDEHKQWAKEYIDPIYEPEPSQECGPGSSFNRPNNEPWRIKKPLTPPSPASCPSPKYEGKGKYTEPVVTAQSPSFANVHAFNSQAAEQHSRQHRITIPILPSPAESINPFSDMLHSEKRREGSQPQPQPQPSARGRRSQIPVYTNDRQANPVDADLPPTPPATATGKSPSTPKCASSRRNSNNPFVNPPMANSSRDRRLSLSQRFPGDMSHRPLELLRQHHKIADRGLYKRRPRAATELNQTTAELASNNPFRKPRPASAAAFTDTIDRLDLAGVGGVYHHSGPFDAALRVRSINPKYSPLDAVMDSNVEALKATSPAAIIDALKHKRPIQGTAEVPPGLANPRTGEVLHYEEGTDMMREPCASGGAYRRWPGVDYLDEDLKGKGEPSYTIEKQEKQKDRSETKMRRSTSDIEMKILRIASTRRGEGSRPPSSGMRRSLAPRDRNQPILRDHASAPMSSLHQQQPSSSRRRRMSRTSEETKRRGGGSVRHSIDLAAMDSNVRYVTAAAAISGSISEPRRRPAVASKNARNSTFFGEGLFKRINNLRRMI